MLFWTLKINQLMNLHCTIAVTSSLSLNVLRMQQVRLGAKTAGIKIYKFLYSPVCSLFSLCDHKRYSNCLHFASICGKRSTYLKIFSSIINLQMKIPRYYNGNMENLLWLEGIPG